MDSVERAPDQHAPHASHVRSSAYREGSDALVSALAFILAFGAAARLLLLPAPGYRFDVATMGEWARALSTQPLSEFYASGRLTDHLPGDLWVLAGFVRVFSYLGGDLDNGASFVMASKLVPLACDLLAGLQIFAIVARLRSNGAALLATAAWVLNPAVIFVSGVWGQWDSLSILAVLVAVRAILAGYAMVAFPVLTYAALVKPQYAAVGVAVALWLAVDWALALRRSEAGARRRLVVRAVLSGVSAVLGSYLVLVVVLTPFGVAVPPFAGDWTLAGRVQAAADAWTRVSMYAFNVWTMFDGAFDRASQQDSGPLLGVSMRIWGIVLFGGCYAVVLGVIALRRGAWTLCWALVVVPYAVFMLMTRQHERYELPVIAFGAVLASLTPRLWWWFAGVSAIVLVNLAYAYALFNPLPGGQMLEHAAGLTVALSVANGLLFLLVLFRGIVTLSRGRGRVRAGLRAGRARLLQRAHG